MTNMHPKVSACDAKGPVAPIEQRVRSGGPVAVEPERAKGGRGPKAATDSPSIDGWSTGEPVKSKK